MKPIIRQYQSGLTSVLFNTRDKWMEYELYCSMGGDSLLRIHLDTFEQSSVRCISQRFETIVPVNAGECVRYVNQEKTQIEVLFVPRHMLTT